MKLKDLFLNMDKKELYAFYESIVPIPNMYEKVTRSDMYKEILKAYFDDPEIIINLCTMEELNILKSLIAEPLKKVGTGYIEYILFKNLESNYLVFSNDTEYYIPEDLVNYIKMAFNVWNEHEYSFIDIKDSVILGLLVIYNVLSIEEMLRVLEMHSINMSAKELKNYLLKPKLAQYISTTRYKKVEYVISKEYEYYQDILKNRVEIAKNYYSLESVISIGKYRINLFEPSLFEFLSFLENHFEVEAIAIIINNLIIAIGCNILTKDLIAKIANNIPELIEQIEKINVLFPCWIYNGNMLKSLS